MQPASIKQFDRYFLGSLVIGLVNSVLSYQDNVAMLQNDPATAAAGFGDGFIITVTLFGFAIPLLLWFLISRRASNVAKWILVVLTAIGIVFMIPTISVIAEQGTLGLVLTLAVTALQIYAITFLFRADAKAWLESKGQDGSTDPSVFD
jgi:formate-dependent nitrite reductase membrane component NrfD